MEEYACGGQKKFQNDDNDISVTLLHFLWTVSLRAMPAYDPFEEIWIIMSNFKQVLCNLSTTLILLLQQKQWNKRCHYIFHDNILC